MWVARNYVPIDRYQAAPAIEFMREAKRPLGAIALVAVALALGISWIALNSQNIADVGGHSDEINAGSLDPDDSLDLDPKGFDNTIDKVPEPCRADDGTKLLVIVTLGQSNAANTGAPNPPSLPGLLTF